MADVFSVIYFQIVFAVKYREALIDPSWESDLYRYISGIASQRGHKVYAINGMPDHIHIFLSFKPAESLSDLVREIKVSSQKFIVEQQYCNFKFQWQAGYGVFSYSEDKVSTVCNYIENQKAHHAKQSFKREFEGFVNNAKVDFGRKEGFDYF